MSLEAEVYVGRDCVHCTGNLVGRYCHTCGQDNRRRDRTLTELFFDGLSEIFSLDGRVFTSARDMMIRPGSYLVAYREGRTQAYVSPMKMFLVVSALFFATLIFGNLTIHQFVPMPAGEAPIKAQLVPNGVILVGGEVRDLYLSPRTGEEGYLQLDDALNAVRPHADATQIRAINDLRTYVTAWRDVNAVLEAWLPRLLWLLMPMYALMLWPLFGASRPLAEHVVFAMWAHCMIFVLLLGLAGLNRVGVHLNFYLLAIPLLIWVTLAARRFYGGPTWLVAIKATGHLVVFFFLVWGPIALTLAYAQVWQQIPATWWNADVGDGEATTQWIIGKDDLS